jgi:hypothetical protein
MKKIKLTDLPQDMTLRELAQVAHAFGYELEPTVEPRGGSVESPEETCKGVTRDNFRCKNKPSRGSSYCHMHAKQETDTP